MREGCRTHSSRSVFFNSTRREATMSSGVAKILVGRLLPGAQEVGEGANRPVRGIAATSSGEIAVIAKRIKDREIAVEVICAMVGRAAGLPIPEPVLLLDNANVWYYGSVDVRHPNLSHYVSSNDSSIMDELERWPALLPAACFDELIANPDRHDGNLLYDGQGFFLIDHGMCIPLGMSANDKSEDYHLNRLLDLQIGICRNELSIQRAANHSREWVELSAKTSVTHAEEHASEGLSLEIQQQLVSFLKGRVAMLGDLLHERIKPEKQRSLGFND